MTPEIVLALAVLAAGVVTYGLKRFFDDKTAQRAHETKIGIDILARVARLEQLPFEFAANKDEIAARLESYKAALKEGIAQVFEFARATKKSELENVAKAAGVIANSNRRTGLPKP